MKFQGSKQITFINFLSNKLSLMAGISTIVGRVFLQFYICSYSTNLIEDFKLDKDIIGYFFGIYPASFIISATFVSVLSKRISRIYIT